MKNLIKRIIHEELISNSKDIFGNQVDNFITEGLIKTTNINITSGILSRYLSHPDSPLNIYINESEGFFNVLIKSNTDVDLLLNTSNNLGWFPSTIFKVENKKITSVQKFSLSNLLVEENCDLYIKFEAKFDIEYIDNRNVFYHTTPTKYVNRILKIGLIPKRGEKISSHPDRIYLSFTQDDVKFLINLLEPHSNNEKFSIFRVTLPDNNPIKLYEDPNFKGFGVYTHENINKEWLELIDNQTET